MHTNITVLTPRLPNTWRWLVALLAALAMTLSFAATAQAAPGPCAPTQSVDLWAKAGTLTLPDSTTVATWGYTDVATGTAQVPGPVLTVSEGACVQVTLHNDLTEASSLALHGQGLAADTVGAAAGGSTVYTFSATQPGTFLYEAGLTTNGARQVGMGLYGALIVQPLVAPGTYASETVLVLSEIDPELNAAPTTFNMGEYKPRYWLINGEAYPDTNGISAEAGSTLLVRYVNAGLNENAMGLLGIDQQVVARDGYATPQAYSVVAETIPAGGTLDTLAAIPAAVGAQYPLYSTAQHLDNDGAAYGGQLLFITAAAPIAPAPVAPPDAVGPTTSGVTASSPTDGSADVSLSASIDDTASGGSNIAAAEYFIDVVGADGTGVSMTGAFSGPTDTATATLLAADVLALTPGDHTLYVHGQDAAGNWGVSVGVTITR